jgi:hypothetical protein
MRRAVLEKIIDSHLGGTEGVPGMAQRENGHDQSKPVIQSAKECSRVSKAASRPSKKKH